MSHENGPIGTEFSPETQTGSGKPEKTKPAKIHLSDCHAIRRELARVYREARNGKLDVDVAWKLSRMLGLMTRSYEISVLEERLRALEAGRR